MKTENQPWTIQETLVQDLEKLLCLEKAFLMTLPMMAQSATDSDLQDEFERLCQQTREQIARLQCLISPGTTTAKALHDDEPRHEGTEPHLMDGILIAEARKKQHAKIALYSTACLWANQLGLNDLEQSLSQNLKEEEANCEKLLQLAHEVMRPTA